MYTRNLDALGNRGLRLNRMRLGLRILAASAALALTAPAFAGPSVFLNGVNIDGVTNQKIDKASITIDAQGNIHIDAKDYAVQSSTTQTKPVMPPGIAGVGTATATPMSKRYFLVTEQSQRGGAQF